MPIPLGRQAWVWKEAPSSLAAFDGAYVRAANGNTNTAADFDFLANWNAWKAATSKPLVAWTFVYATTDPTQGAAALARADAPAYCLDVEDWQGTTVTADRARALVAEFRRRRPDRPVGFSTYATRAQAVDHGVPWDTLAEVCDFSSPQVYFAYQADRLAQVWAEHESRDLPCLVSVSPNDYSGWATLARTCGVRQGSVVFWRLGVLTDPQVATIGQMDFGQETPMALDQTYFDDKFAMLKTEILNSYRQLDHGTTDKETAPNSLKEIVGLFNGLKTALGDLKAALSDVQTSLDGGVAVVLTAEQLDDVKAAAENAARALEGSALIQLAVSPPSTPPA